MTDKRVLVVDDDASITDGLIALLELENIAAIGAYAVDEARELLMNDEFTVVLADVRISSEEEGFRLLELVKELNPEAKIASMTGHATDALREELDRLGSTVVLEKPVASAQIVTLVQSLLDDVDGAAVVTPQNAEALYVELKRTMYAIPMRRFGLDATEAEDIVQQAFMLYLEKMDVVMTPRTWITGTLINLCKQRIHRKVQSRSREEDADLGAVETTGADEVSVLAVREALAQIDERSRTLCTLIAIEGRSYDEVSQIMSMPVGSIGPSYIRAKAKLRKLLEVN
jgi:RNA polymerase sigma factor (sigma-70 family)